MEVCMAKVQIPLEKFGLCVITGGSSGIGEAFVNLLAVRCPECRIINLSRSPLGEIKGTNNNIHISCDLSNDDSKKSAIKELLRVIEEDSGERKKLLLINNSGFGTYDTFPDPNLQSQLDMLEVNAKAPLWLTGELLSYLRTFGGAILNVASIAGFQPTPYFATYGGTKAFLLNWSLALAEELRPQGISVLTLCPGPVQTNFFKSAGFSSPPVSQWGGLTPDQVATAGLVSLERGRNLLITGWNNRLLSFMTRFVPLRWIGRLSAFVMKKMRLEQFQTNRT